MRILAVADLHGKAERLGAVAKGVATFAPGAVIVAGDVASRRNLPSTLAFLNALGPPVFLIRGNCEGSRFGKLVPNFQHLNNLTAIAIGCGGVHLFGLGGTLPLPFDSRICWREAALLDALAPAPAPSILVVHPPPYGVLDQVLGGLHTGSRGVARWIIRHQPDLVLCGHIHGQSGSAVMEKTRVVNCAMGRHCNGALIDMRQEGFRVRML